MGKLERRPLSIFEDFDHFSRFRNISTAFFTQPQQ